MTFEPTLNIGVLPDDWPAPGPIDLAIHDLPHASSKMEWWYVNAHVTTAGARRFSLFASFFRVDVTPDGGRERTFAHFLTWGLVDPAAGRYTSHTRLDPLTPRLALNDLDEGRNVTDGRIARALREVVAAGRVPLPDRLLTREADVALDALALDYDGNRFVKDAEGAYQLTLAADGQELRLRFVLDKPAVRHGDDGVVRGIGGEEMFYYFSPRCRVEGALRVDGVWLDVEEGSGWYDHEFGEPRHSPAGGGGQVGWNWLAAQLDNGWEVCAYDLVDRANHEASLGRWAIVIAPSGERRAYTDFSFEALGHWTSTKTFNAYPVRYRLEVPRAGIVLDAAATMPGQEIPTIISPPAFWEGSVAIAGHVNGAPVAGQGFVERSGFSAVDTTDDFFAAVGRETRRAIDLLLPERPSTAQALPLISGAGREHFIDGVDLDQYARTVLWPIREIILRGGKAWRSYGMIVCMDVVGGNSQRFAEWLALPELLHVGSLIIDDVQDRSDVRRGGPACHTLYGEALAINAGCASYFLAQMPAVSSGLSDRLLVRIYEAYFEAVRAAHAGQALDIDGLGRLAAEVAESGDAALLERRVLAVHRLKSAAPAGALARMAALIGGGTEEQATELGRLFESFGVAFQIIDDVLNLRGFEQDRKTRGEDIAAGKITAPVAKAMRLLPAAPRQRLWDIVRSRPADADLIAEAIDLIGACGALDACEEQARELVETAWARVDPLVPDSQAKMRLRAFGWFVLDRYY